MTTGPTKAENPAGKLEAEKQTNCLNCNKPIKKLKRYYRSGKYYCNKTCWKTYKTKSKEEKK